eukprot:TRINITY_DN74095_c0_g1_i1.p1 TRINITY_DN74095_c0_g1~~TRINITY_DN74095_c0_g1_i1.p1  ORF type:complete len:477 (-),score=79.67 TRINITY_DN74095_c0_g1_i1:364-1794(-)
MVSSKPLFAGIPAALVACVAVYVGRLQRLSIPPHLQNHTVIHETKLIPPELGKELNALMREMGADETGFPTNVAADLKTGVSNVTYEHIGEAIPLEADGSCAHPFLVRSQTRDGVRCTLPQRVDVGRHFVMTGGPEAIREPYERMVSRVSSFGRYMFDLSKYKPVEALFGSEAFQSAAVRVCPQGKQVLDPFQFNFIMQVPGQTVALHLDAPHFVGATRFRFPQWLLAAMAFSGLFADRFVDQVQIVGYLHDNFAASPASSLSKEDALSTGRFLYYTDEASATPESLPAQSLAGLAVDGSKTMHAAGVFQPWVPPPAMDKDRDNALFFKGGKNEAWELRSDGEVIGNYTSDDLRMTIVYRARCFASEAAVQEYRRSQEEPEALSLETVLRTFATDLVRRGLLNAGTNIDDLVGSAAGPAERLRLAILIMDNYIKYPLPDINVAWVPLNYCALPRTIKVWPLKAAVQALLSPFCGGV